MTSPFSSTVPTRTRRLLASPAVLGLLAAGTSAFAQPAVTPPATSAAPLEPSAIGDVPAAPGPYEPIAEAPVEPIGEPAAANDFFAALKGGKVTLDVRGRYEYADFSNFPDQSNATTVRTRLGYLTGDWLGLQGFVELEDVRAADDQAFNAAGLNGVTDRPPIADPEVTELNQAWVAYSLPQSGGDGLAAKAKIGRQVIALDDQRFIGHVGWRQDNQTFDAGTFTTDLGLDGFEIFYGYVTQVNRIFGEERDFESDSHLVNASYKIKNVGTLTGFAYLLDFANGVAASSDTFGVRLAGSVPFNDTVSLSYAGSWATQSEAGDNPVEFTANYIGADLGLAVKQVGTLGVGYELLGSDDGVAAFQTPLATLHKFNGYADQFLVTPAEGLQDLYFTATAGFLPKGTRAFVRYHIFTSDEGSTDFGTEFDAVIGQKLNENLDVGAKFAYFFGDDGRPDVTRVTVDLTLSF